MMISKKFLIGSGVAVAAGVTVTIGIKILKKYIENKVDDYMYEYDEGDLEITEDLLDDNEDDDDIDKEEVIENNTSSISTNSIGIGIFDGNAVKRDMEESTNEDEDPFITAVRDHEKAIIKSFEKDDDKDTQNTPQGTRTVRVSANANYSIEPSYDIEKIAQGLKEHMGDDNIQKLIGQGETKLGLMLLVSKPDMSLDVEFDDGDNMVLYNNGEQVVLYDYNEDQYKFILDRDGDRGKLYGYIVDTEFPTISDSTIKNRKPITANLSKSTNDDFLAKLRITDYDPDDIEEIGHLKVYDYNALLSNYVAFCKNNEISWKTTFPVFLK